MGNDEPVLQVVRGTPTAEELAALVGVVLTRVRTPAVEAAPGGSNWVRSARPGFAGALPDGAPSWRASALPR